MKKKEKPKHDEQGDVWMLTYSDLMTLLTCFFLLMMVFANYEKPGSNAVAQQISASISKTESQSKSLDDVSNEIKLHPDILQKAKMSVSDHELQITFASSMLFEEGSTQISNDIEPILQSLIDIIKAKDINFRVLIEGHADPYEYRTIPNVDSPWELGAIRASKVMSRFESFGFDPHKLASLTKGDIAPLEPNNDENGQPLLVNMVLNRRVVIRVIEPKSDDKQYKFGLGVYYDEKINE